MRISRFLEIKGIWLYHAPYSTLGFCVVLYCIFFFNFIHSFTARTERQKERGGHVGVATHVRGQLWYINEKNQKTDLLYSFLRATTCMVLNLRILFFEKIKWCQLNYKAGLPKLAWQVIEPSIFHLFGNSLFSWNWKLFVESIIDKASMASDITINFSSIWEQLI